MGARLTRRGILAIAVLALWRGSALAQTDPLPSWTEGAVTAGRIECVRETRWLS
jgi:hypothetical protein